MLLAEVAAAVEDVAATTSRTAKTRRLAVVLRAASTAEVPVLVHHLAGELPQRRTGLGYRSLADLPEPAAHPTLTVLDLDAAFTRAQELSGPGSSTARRSLVRDLASRATAVEQRLVVGLVGGELRQGAARGVLVDAVAAAADVPAAAVRRAVTLTGGLADVAVALLGVPADGRAAVLDRFGLVPGQPLSPMLAQAAPDLAAALARTGPAAVEWKVDGVRVQVHRWPGGHRVLTRSLDDVTERLPEVVEAVAALPVDSVVLDGEVVALGAAHDRPEGPAPTGHPALRERRPLPFQETGSLVATRRRPADSAPLTTVLFDVLHLDGRDLLDEPYRVRREVLERLAPHLAVPALLLPDAPDEPDDPDDPDEPGSTDRAGSTRAEAAAFVEDALARGQEGVVVKALDAPYAMGRRGAAWVKVKPRTTFDLVVLAAEWGHGRRAGLLSNLHLGARDPDGRHGRPGGFVMLGKTFKGMTDELLRWQTDALQRVSTGGTRARVDVRPELVVEVAVDGVQTSTRYPAGMALRFARVVRYRPDKRPDEADTVDDVRALHEAGG
ncbi:ATP-dependent DNA ligase [Thalassiella azotivora]